MADLGKIKPLYPTTPVRPLGQESAQKEPRKKKREGDANEKDLNSKQGKINEYI